MRARLLAAMAVCCGLMALPSSVSAQTEVVEYYALDQLGSVRVVFDENGAVTSRRDYEPFGAPVTPVTSDPKVWAGLFTDEESGLEYAQARMYETKTGRFLSVDPVQAGLFNPQKWNRYSYVLNSPANFIDSDGRNPAAIGLGGWCALNCAYQVPEGELGSSTNPFTASSSPGTDDIFRALWDDFVTSVQETPRLAAEALETLGEVVITTLDGVLGAEGLGGPEADIVPTVRNDPGAVVTGVAAIATIAGAVRNPRAVIGRVKDLKNLRPGEYSLLDRLPNRRDPRLNWKQNDGVLRQEMRRGLPIRDASIGDTGGQFLNAERHRLMSQGWTLDPVTGYWMPPGTGGRD